MANDKINAVHYAPHYLKSYGRLPERIKRLQNEKERMFRRNPFEAILRTHKLKGKLAELWSYSVNWQCRVLFRFIDERTVIFYDIGTHEIYK